MFFLILCLSTSEIEPTSVACEFTLFTNNFMAYRVSSDRYLQAHYYPDCTYLVGKIYFYDFFGGIAYAKLFGISYDEPPADFGPEDGAGGILYFGRVWQREIAKKDFIIYVCLNYSIGTLEGGGHYSALAFGFSHTLKIAKLGAEFVIRNFQREGAMLSFDIVYSVGVIKLKSQ